MVDVRISVARTCGFCTGVNRAIRLATSEINKPVYILGELIHNERVLKSFAEQGILTINLEEALKLTSGTVIIRAHGISPQVRAKLNETALKIVDATCPNVLKIHEIVKKGVKQGSKIIIIGNGKHPEVIGINGCADGEAIIIEDENLPSFEGANSYICVVQTTFNEKQYNIIINKLKNNIKLLVNYNTICYTTKVRQSEAEMLSLQCDAMFVIGSKISSNTCKLYELCGRNCKNTYLIENIEDLTKVTNKIGIQKLGITTGASTPKELVMEVILVMSSEVESVKIEDCAQEVAAVDTTATEAVNVEVKKATEVKKVKTERKINNMEDVMNASVFGLREGKKVKCTVIKADSTGILVNFGGKKDGFIDSVKAGLENYDASQYKPGDVFEAVVVENKTSSKECIMLDKRVIDEVLDRLCEKKNRC
ncbi:MAG: 4-hydroxy-3-methylbut-2-enyl diphosphate reductase [Clostridia bacterium]|nr:4-hydroxy-3-methylbut-2-enyl diphosphate reductase [Clostridia bacterium]